MNWEQFIIDWLDNTEKELKADAKMVANEEEYSNVYFDLETQVEKEVKDFIREEKLEAREEDFENELFLELMDRFD